MIILRGFFVIIAIISLLFTFKVLWKDIKCVKRCMKNRELKKYSKFYRKYIHDSDYKLYNAQSYKQLILDIRSIYEKDTERSYLDKKRFNNNIRILDKSDDTVALFNIFPIVLGILIAFYSFSTGYTLQQESLAQSTTDSTTMTISKIIAESDKNISIKDLAQKIFLETSKSNEETRSKQKVYEKDLARNNYFDLSRKSEQFILKNPLIIMLSGGYALFIFIVLFLKYASPGKREVEKRFLELCVEIIEDK